MSNNNLYIVPEQKKSSETQTPSSETLVIDTSPSRAADQPAIETQEERLRRAEVAAANMQYLRRMIELAERQERRVVMKQKRKAKNRAKNKVARQSRKRNR